MPTLDEQFEKLLERQFAGSGIQYHKTLIPPEARDERWRWFLAGAAAEREAAAQIADQCWHENGAICSDQDNCGIHVHTRLSASAIARRIRQHGEAGERPEES